MLSENKLRLHIGGHEPKDGWKILNIQPGPGVDFVGSCSDLSMFPNDSADEVYASHVIEHLDFIDEMQKTLSEIRRILKPGGVFMCSVPDMDMLCHLFISPDLNADSKFHIMRMMFGAHSDKFDYHQVGLNFDFLSSFLAKAEFSEIKRVTEFGIFNDCSSLKFNGHFISLNVIAK